MNAKAKPSLSFDLEKSAGRTPIAGMDEAGRGPLAGPVVAACVMLPTGCAIQGIDDSKRLTQRKREALYEEITARAIAWGVGMRGPESIDTINILNATRAAMQDACAAMGRQAGVLLVDYVGGLNLPVPTLPITHGDALSYHVAAASILAKVTRDRLMLRLHEEYPAYGFAGHKGYGTQAHLRALEEHGPCPIHRRSFLQNLKPSVHAIGVMGEDLTAKYMKARGYDILERRWRGAQGECDIIARMDGALVFVEVKARRKGSSAIPREAVTAQKQSRIACAAQASLLQGGMCGQPCRFDVAEVAFDASTWDITYIKDAFRAREGNLG